MTTVVPKLSKSDAAPFKALQSARAGGNPSASFARALKDADASKAAVQQAAELADNSVRLRGQTGDSDGSAGLAGSAEAGDDSIVNGNRSSKSGGLESSAKKPSDLSEASAADSANVAGIAAVAGVAPPLESDAGTPIAPNAIASADDARTTEVANLLAPGVLAPGVSAKALELAQAAALWANGGLKDGSAEVAANLGLDASSKAVEGGSIDSAATSANSAASAKSSPSASAKSSPSASANVLSTSQGSTISGVMEPSMFTAPGGGVGSAVSSDSSPVGPSGASIASASMSSGLAGGPIGFGGASAALQGAGQSTATNVLLNAERLEASVSGLGATGPRAANGANSGAVSVASALAAASSVRSAQSSALTDSVGLSATAGSITGTLSVPVMSGSAGADLGGNALGTQTGGAGSESGASSDRSRSGSSNAFTVQAASPSEPNVATALSGAADASARPSRSVGLGSYANATTNSNATTNAASSVDVAANQPPVRDVNAPEAQASVAADPRAAWRDLRSKWDQPIRANAPKG
jgi:hypothetical protein